MLLVRVHFFVSQHETREGSSIRGKAVKEKNGPTLCVAIVGHEQVVTTSEGVGLAAVLEEGAQGALPSWSFDQKS